MWSGLEMRRITLSVDSVVVSHARIAFMPAWALSEVALVAAPSSTARACWLEDLARRSLLGAATTLKSYRPDCATLTLAPGQS